MSRELLADSARLLGRIDRLTPPSLPDLAAAPALRAGLCDCPRVLLVDECGPSCWAFDERVEVEPFRGPHSAAWDNRNNIAEFPDLYGDWLYRPPGGSQMTGDQK